MSQPQTNRLKIANPPLEDELRTYLMSDVSAAGTVLATIDNTGFVQSGTDDYYILIGNYGDQKSEIVLVDASDADTDANSFKVSALKYSHSASDPVTFIRYNQIKVYGLEASGGVKNLLTTINIDPSEQFTEYTYEGATYSFFVIAYYNEDDDKLSGYSEEIENSDFGRLSAKKIIEAGLRKAMTRIDESGNSILNWNIALDVLQDGLDEIIAAKRKWSFLRKTNTTTTTVPNRQYINKPSDLSELEFIIVDDLQLNYLERSEYNKYTVNDTIVPTGKPTHYTIKNNAYYLYPTPDIAYDVIFEYYQIPDVITDLSTTVSVTFKTILIYYCASQFAYIRGNDKRGDKMYALFQKLLEEQIIEFSGPEQSGEAESIDRTSIYGEDYHLNSFVG